MLGSLCLICRYPPAFSCRALRSFCSAIFAEVAGILSTTVGTIPTLHSALGSRGGTVLRVHFIQHHLCLSNIFCEFQYTLIRYRLSAASRERKGEEQCEKKTCIPVFHMSVFPFRFICSDAVVWMCTYTFLNSIIAHQRGFVNTEFRVPKWFVEIYNYITQLLYNTDKRLQTVVAGICSVWFADAAENCKISDCLLTNSTIMI